MRISRQDYQRIVKAGINTGEFIFLRTFIQSWLAQFPGELSSTYYLAKIAHLQDDFYNCKELLNEILSKDPEFGPAYQLLLLVGDEQEKKAAASNIHVISGEISDMSYLFPWAVTLRSVRTCLKRGDIQNAEKLLRNILGKESNNILVALEHVRLSSRSDSPQIFHHLSEIYSNRWPNCIHFRLLTAQAKMKIGLEYQAISLLHSCVSLDPQGQVVKRLWGSDHEFNSLWPKDQFMDLDIQIPASIAVPLNWNRLQAGENISKRKSSNQENRTKTNRTLKISTDFSQQRQNVYVILTTKSGMQSKYGEKTSDVLRSKLQDLRDLISNKENWKSHLFEPDDYQCMSYFGLKAIDEVDPWKIKLSLGDLNKKLQEVNQTIGAVLIVGGHEIVPFHALSNPTDDSDGQVLSDNPYSTSTGNYLLPKWAVGRLPDEKGSDAGLLLAQIRQVIQYHQSLQSNRNFLTTIFNSMLNKFTLRRIIRQVFKNPNNFGYSTAVWRRSSLAAFRPIGKGADLRITPPYDADTIDVENLMKAKCAYINLHGLSNTPEWYGQRDFSEEPSGPDFPVAVTTQNIPNIQNNIDMIFTEACYGGYVVDKKIEESMALKLIAIGSQGLVGSTCISYGSVFTPLIGADLLAFIFWKYLREGYSFGESLVQAKIGLVKVMNQRQEYLDGEDQKTLMSFVLYGDPLAYLEPNTGIDIHNKAYMDQSIEYHAVADQEGVITANLDLQHKITKELNEIIQSYIPSLNNANVKIREYKIGAKKLLQGEQNIESLPNGLKKYTQIQYSQQTHVARTTHEHFARVTIDEQGKIIKLAVSR